MGLIILGVLVAGVATAANNQEESVVLWGLLALVFCIVGGAIGGLIGQVVGGAAAFGLMQLKIARYG